jgi:hypothetical protein
MKGSSGIRVQDGEANEQSAPEKLKGGDKNEQQVFGQLLVMAYSNPPRSICEHHWPLRIGVANRR